MNRSVSNVCRDRRPGKPVRAIVTNVSRNRRPGNAVSAFGRKPTPSHLQLQTSWQRPGVTKERAFKWVYRTSRKLVFSWKDYFLERDLCGQPFFLVAVYSQNSVIEKWKAQNEELFEMLNSQKNLTRISRKPPDFFCMVQVGDQNIEGCFKESLFGI
jgi:hypothetical protein